MLMLLISGFSTTIIIDDTTKKIDQVINTVKLEYDHHPRDLKIVSAVDRLFRVQFTLLKFKMGP